MLLEILLLLFTDLNSLRDFGYILRGLCVTFCRVAENEASNKMGTLNIASIFGPALMSPDKGVGLSHQVLRALVYTLPHPLASDWAGFCLYLQSLTAL